MKKRLLALALCMALTAIPFISNTLSVNISGIDTYRFIFDDIHECD